ncbi:MAG: methyl-accepting chemotaxis protein [Xanthomonadales bacterium]|nr:methyl-accepting chemotaxis protein [Xanthomonadales bacterium]
MSAAAGTLQARETNTFLYVLAALLVAVFLGLILNFVFLNDAAEQQRRHLGLITETQVLSQQIAKFANEAAGGTFDAFDQLRETRDKIQRNLDQLTEGQPESGLSPLPSEQGVADARNRLVEETWTGISGEVRTILAASTVVTDLSQTVEQFSGDIPVLQGRLDEVAKVLRDINARPQQIYMSAATLALADKMLRRVNVILSGGIDAGTTAEGLGDDINFLRNVLDGLLNGNNDMGIRPIQNPEALELLGSVFQVYNDIESNAQRILGASDQLVQVKRASDAIFFDSETLLNDAAALQEVYTDLTEGERLWPSVRFGVILGLAAIFLVVVLLWLLYRDQRARFKVTEDLNQRNQEAILRLLDEMGSLAEGDLTVKATVTEDITGAIADSINFAIEALRSLVTTINETAVQVASAAQETQATAMHLAEASEHQAQQITSASAAINEIAVSIDEVSKNSAESADVAQRSVAIAAKGAEVVRQTIDGMDNIRDQIQETSKRIKRLGESSQEIGDIVELINDIAEQTNILALNAAIQAASAGEAGRGFAVVADEVQRLAERASNATKRIETLVQTIQADTNEAVISMEQTTSEVVSGARLAEDAGEALGEIEKVSHDLADLIQNISEAARQQSAAATNISGTMNVIQEITTQTSAGTSQTAESIGHLADLAAELRRSVADFKLPA